MFCLTTSLIGPHLTVACQVGGIRQESVICDIDPFLLPGFSLPVAVSFLAMLWLWLPGVVMD